MPRKISNAPRPIEPLPVSVGSPASQSAPKPEPNPPKEATSPAAIQACHRFWRAARDCDQAIKMAYEVKVGAAHWASVKEQWRVWRHDAERRAELCKTEGLPEPLLTAEVFHRLRSLDHQWKIACDYRNNDTKSQAAEAPRTRRSPQTEKALERLINYRGEKPLGGMKKKELAHVCGVSENTAVKAFKEFKKQSRQLTVKIDKIDK